LLLSRRKTVLGYPPSANILPHPHPNIALPQYPNIIFFFLVLVKFFIQEMIMMTSKCPCP
jgi:hypothetical protein